ncbi:hypothetical protein BD413DRAFT_600239 [Trametes elegans]|nr:hypothetical protein BD413DRAFT_600239 [Trametes elegans]
MKTAFAALSFVAAALAQSVTILSPTTNTTLARGSTFVVDVDKPDTLSPSTDVSVVIGLVSCASASCSDMAAGGILGNILYKGDYTPQPRPNSSHLFQNYSIVVPDSLQTGPAVLNVAHFYLLGAGPGPTLETVNTTVVIQ